MNNQKIALKNKLEKGSLFKISHFKEVIKRTKPHTHDGYYELIFILKGEGFHLIEAENFSITAPELYFLKPGQLHCWQFTSIPKGYVLLFKEAFFDALLEAPILTLLKNLNTTSRVTLPADYSPVYLFEEMLREYRNPTDYSVHIISGHLRSIFSRILLFSNLEDVQKGTNSMHNRFQELLRSNIPELHRVNQFAELLNTSPQNLNAACRKFTGKSAGDHITDQLLLEAKRYILHTDMNIGEIADTLRFNDASYFVKFFKRHQDVTPLQFRESYFQ